MWVSARAVLVRIVVPWLMVRAYRAIQVVCVHGRELLGWRSAGNILLVFYLSFQVARIHITCRPLTTRPDTFQEKN